MANSVYLTRSAEAPGRARAFVRQAMVDAPSPIVETTELLVSELVTNAVLHTPAARIRIDIDPEGSGVRVAVHDPVPRLDRSPAPLAPSGDGGYGLGIVEALATRWGVEEADTGKRVWFELSP